MAFIGEMWDVLETYKYVQGGEEKQGYKNVGVAFKGSGANSGGFNIKFRGVVTIVPGVNDLVLLVHKDRATDFPPREAREQQPMEEAAPSEEQGYPTQEPT